MHVTQAAQYASDGLYEPDPSLPADAAVAHWVAFESAQVGVPYYYNTSTGVTTWVRPAWLPAAHPVVPAVAR